MNRQYPGRQLCLCGQRQEWRGAADRPVRTRAVQSAAYLGSRAGTRAVRYVGNGRGDGVSLKTPATAGDYMIGYFTSTSRRIIGSRTRTAQVAAGQQVELALQPAAGRPIQ